MDFPTPEEEYELMYGEELEMMEDFDGELAILETSWKLLSCFLETSLKILQNKIFILIYSDLILIFQDPEAVNVVQSASTQKSVASNKHESILSSPALSQISINGFNLTPELRGKKTTSTPFLSKLTKIQELNDENRAFNEIQNTGVKRKRRLEELFGDIYDIEEEDNFMKKHKTDEERDLDTIARIVEARRTFETQINPLKKTNFDRLEALHKFKRDNLSRTIPK